MPLDDLKAAGRHFGASINDLFLAGLTEGAVRYHADRGVEVDAFNTSFVLSTRTDHAIGGNSFTPIPVQVAGAPMSTRRAGRRHSCPAGGEPGGDGVRGRHGRGVGHRQPAAHVGGDAGRPRAGGPDRLRHVQPPRRAVHAVRRRGSRLRHRHDGSRGGHRVQCDRVVVRRATSTSDCSSIPSRSMRRRTSAMRSSPPSPIWSTRPRRRPGDEVRRHRRDLPRPARRHHRRPGRDRRHRLVASAMRSNRSRHRVVVTAGRCASRRARRRFPPRLRVGSCGRARFPDGVGRGGHVRRVRARPDRRRVRGRICARAAR